MAGGFPLLSGVDLEMTTSSLTVLVGANGAGKTSLLRLLAGLIGLSAGEGSVLGLDLATADRRQLRRRVGWLGHEGSFYDDLSVEENLTFAARALGRPLEELTNVLERVGLSGRRTTVAKQLSAAFPDTNKKFSTALVQPLIKTFTPVSDVVSVWRGCYFVAPSCGCSMSPMRRSTTTLARSSTHCWVTWSREAPRLW